MKKIVMILLALMLLMSSALAEEKAVGRLAMVGLDEQSVLEKAQSTGLRASDQKVNAFLSVAELNRNIFYDNLMTMLLALNADEITEIGIGLHTAQYIVARNDSLAYEESAIPLTDTFCMMVMDSNQDIYDLINNAIIELKADGTLDALIAGELSIESDPLPVEMPEFKGSRTIRVAVTGDLPPMDFATADGTPAGFNVALLSEIANRTQMNIELVQVDSAARSTALATGRVDAIFWSKAYLFNGVVAMAEELSGGLLTEGYFAEPYARVFKK